jgi:hypothetical protein
MFMEPKHKKKEAVGVEIAKKVGKESEIAKLLYYGMFSAGVLFIAYAGDVQSPLHQGIAITLMTTALYRLNTMREEERTRERLQAHEMK